LGGRESAEVVVEGVSLSSHARVAILTTARPMASRAAFGFFAFAARLARSGLRRSRVFLNVNFMRAAVKHLVWNVKPAALGEVKSWNREFGNILSHLKAKIGSVHQVIRPDWHAVTNQNAGRLERGKALPFHKGDKPGRAGEKKNHG